MLKSWIRPCLDRSRRLRVSTMKVEGKVGISNKDESRLKVVVGGGKHKKNARDAWNAFMFEFRTVYRTQHPNASSADVMSAGREEWRNMAEDVMRDTQEEWRNVTEEKAPYHGGKAVKKNPDHDGSKATTDKGSKKAVNKGPEKTRATFREG
nr:uncharacterized protein LOC127309375 [Lolium perenne]